MFGILTWYKVYNYGSVLQAYSLVSKINDLGYSAELIQYCRDENVIFTGRIDKLADTLRRIPPALVRRLFWKHYRLKARRFDLFHEKDIPQSRVYTTGEEIARDCGQYEAFLCGSDQIWTPSIRYLDFTYFLDFVPERIGKIAYAPSIGCNYIPEAVRPKMKELIDRIDFLSIREEHGAALIEELCGIRPEVVLDPTLLKTKEEWEKFSVQPEFSEPYILCYFLGNRKPVREFALRLKKRLVISW